MIFQPCLELIFGPMFSGKSSELLRRIRRIKSVSNNEESIDDTIMLINSAIDTRVSEDAIKTHDGNILQAIKCKELSEINNLHKTKYEKCKIIFIDEAQFFPDLYDFCTQAVSKDFKHVVCGWECGGGEGGWVGVFIGF